jgi:hypothetical protein
MQSLPVSKFWQRSLHFVSGHSRSIPLLDRLAFCSTGSPQKRAFNSYEASQGQQHTAVYRGDRHGQFQTVALNQPAIQRYMVWGTCLSHQVLESWLCPLSQTAKFGARLTMQLPYLHGRTSCLIEYTVPYMSSCRGFVGLSHYKPSCKIYVKDKPHKQYFILQHQWLARPRVLTHFFYFHMTPEFCSTNNDTSRYYVALQIHSSEVWYPGLARVPVASVCPCQLWPCQYHLWTRNPRFVSFGSFTSTVSCTISFRFFVHPRTDFAAKPSGHVIKPLLSRGRTSL